jgi:hypothetical protein
MPPSLMLVDADIEVGDPGIRDGGGIDITSRERPIL